MNRNNFISRQLDIRQREINLHGDTQQLLFDILTNMSGINLDRLSGYHINDSIEIVDVDGSYRELLNVLSWEDESYQISIDNITQEEQKLLIDYIIENNLI